MLCRSQLFAACVVGRQRVTWVGLPSSVPAFCIDESTRIPNAKAGIASGPRCSEAKPPEFGSSLAPFSSSNRFPFTLCSPVPTVPPLGPAGWGGQERSQACSLPGTSCPVTAFLPHIFTQSLQLAKPQRPHRPAAGSSSPAPGGANAGKEGWGWRRMAKGLPCG